MVTCSTCGARCSGLFFHCSRVCREADTFQWQVRKLCADDLVWFTEPFTATTPDAEFELQKKQRWHGSPNATMNLWRFNTSSGEWEFHSSIGVLIDEGQEVS